ncbi:MAG TPA: protein-disulfide reductase DsbD family protein, partial [Bacteroidales bacterium]|nr:protein-disulfide reductase DsbD family protein [Bacteroidales bacterium]
MRRYFLAFLGILLSSAVSYSQFIEQPASWNYQVNRLEENLFEIRFTATLEQPWHMYDLGPYENGPQPTSFSFDLQQGIALAGTMYMESPPAKEFDPLFNMDIGSFAGTGTFVQKLRLDVPSATIRASVEWQVCDGTSCLPPEEESFEIFLGDPDVPVAAGIPDAPVKDTSDSLWKIILQAIAFGLVALVTPCVFPMVPMTVS